MPKEVKFPVMYAYLVESMKNYQEDSIGTIRIKKVLWLMGRFRIPRALQIPIFYEMMEYGLIKKIDRHKASIKLNMDDNLIDKVQRYNHYFKIKGEWGLIKEIEEYDAKLNLKEEDEPSKNLSDIYNRCGVWK
jgi:hypothetical protein